MLTIKRIIIGVILIIGFIIQPTMVHAFYSPVIAGKASIIKQHLSSARQQNGTGSVEDAVQNVIEQNKLARERGTAEGLPPEVSNAQLEIVKDVFWNILKKPTDDLFLIFNLIPSAGFSFASKCLRDDIWGLQNLRDAVVQEMLKAYLMYDRYHGDLLKQDYKWLIAHIEILKEYGNKPMKSIDTLDMTANEYLFGHKGDINYYILQFPSEEREEEIQDAERCKDICEKIQYWKSEDQCEQECKPNTKITWSGCPQSEFPPAFNEVWESIQNVGVLASGGGSDWGSIWEMAESRARRRAAEWIKANQITLTIGGEEGGSPQSLIKGGGLDRFKGQWNTQLRILKDMIGPLIPLFSWGIYNKSDEEEVASYGCMYFYQGAGVYKACTVDQLLDYKKCQDKENSTSCPDDCEESQSGGINCDLYKPRQITSGTKQIKELQLKSLEHEKTIQRAETAYIYNVQLNSVGEEAILAIDKKMRAIDETIKSGFEAVGNEDNRALPTIYNNLVKFKNNYCGGE